MKTRTLTVAALFIAGLMAVQPAAAQTKQPKPGDHFGDWQYECQELGKSGKVCGLYQAIADRGTKREVLQITVRPIGRDGKGIGMVVKFPLGIFLGTGLVGKVDDNPQFSFGLQTCTTHGCDAAIEVNDRLLAEMETGKRFVIGFKIHPTQKTTIVPVSLKGFKDGIAAIRKK